MWSGTSRTVIWELVRHARSGPIPDILNQKFWGWVLTSTQSRSQTHWSLRTIALGASWEVPVGCPILCLSTNIFPFCPVPPSTAIKTITSLISKSRFVFLYLPLKPVLRGSGQELAHTPLQTDYFMFFVTGRTSCPVLPPTPPPQHTFQAGRWASSPSSGS